VLDIKVGFAWAFVYPLWLASLGPSCGLFSWRTSPPRPPVARFARAFVFPGLAASVRYQTKATEARVKPAPRKECHNLTYEGPRGPSAARPGWGVSPSKERHSLRRPERSETRSEGPVNKSSCFLGDPPPDPRFLASLGALSLVELDHCSVVDLLYGRKGPKDLLVDDGALPVTYEPRVVQ
jgi:hypothetical protein